MESEDDDFYSGEAMDDDSYDYYNSDDADDEDDYEFIEEDLDDDSLTASSRRQQQSFTILREEDIRQLQEEDITRVSTVLSISRVDASILLRHFNWSVSKVHDAWFADEDGVRKSVGLLERPVVHFSNARELTCGICFEVYTCDKITFAACGHPFCIACWKGYISTTINDGPGCLMLRCPDPSCRAAVGQDMINMLASTEDKEKYAHYLLRSYVEDNRKGSGVCHCTSLAA